MNFAMLLALATSLAGAPSPSLQDVLGEAVPLGPPAQAHATILFFMNERLKNESAAFAREVDERLLDGPVETVSIVDVRRYGGWLKRLAMGQLRKSAAEARERRRQRRVTRGADASPSVVNRWHLVADFDGSLFRRFGVAPELVQPLAFVLDTAGKLRGPFHEAASVVRAVGVD
jgi:hypothetical protein